MAFSDNIFSIIPSWRRDSLPLCKKLSMHVAFLLLFILDRLLNLLALSAAVLLILDIFWRLNIEYPIITDQIPIT